ncbi:MAG TPA: hypothetical protein GXX46_12620, partial [Peptococcaceae bacterium]|nr:hypothetical protein [Peptococcaceae bacterium]
MTTPINQNIWTELIKKAEGIRLFQNNSLGDQIIADIFCNAEDIVRRVVKKAAN